jgi:hypothetical protein
MASPPAGTAPSLRSSPPDPIARDLGCYGWHYLEGARVLCVNDCKLARKVVMRNCGQ